MNSIFSHRSGVQFYQDKKFQETELFSETHNFRRMYTAKN